MSEWKKICCAVDFSEPSRLALSQAAELARQLQARLTLVYVIEVDAGVVLPGGDFVDVKVAADAERTIEAWAAEAEELSQGPAVGKVLMGEVAAEILRFAREEGFDLLVVASKGRTGLKELVLGSVAERVARHAPCPLLISRPREPGVAEEIEEEVAQYQA